MPTTFRGDNFDLRGDLTLADGAVDNAKVSPGADIARAKLNQDTAQKYIVPFYSMRVHDAIQTVLPSPSAADDLGFPATVTMGTVAPLLESYDLKTLTQTLYARFSFTLPPEYDAGETITARIRAGMKTNVADVSCTLDLEVFKADRDGGAGADLQTTTAPSMNNLTNADLDFDINESGLSPGDVLDCRLSVACVDAATATAVIAEILEVAFLLDIRG